MATFSTVVPSAAVTRTSATSSVVASTGHAGVIAMIVEPVSLTDTTSATRTWLWTMNSTLTGCTKPRPAMTTCSPPVALPRLGTTP